MGKQLTAEQLQRFQKHADMYPVGDTAQLLAHIEYLQDEIDTLWKLYDPLNIKYSSRHTAKEGGE